MIPNSSTPIKNEILINIYAKGLLTKEEMRIIFYIIRWSWGFDGVKRRQDWTKKITRKKIADDIEMNKGHLSINLNKMIEENIIIIKNNCYQFNEHYEDWKRLPKRKLYREVAEKETKVAEKETKVTEKETKVAEKETSAGLKPLQDKPLPDRKETLKCTFKETPKEKKKFLDCVLLSKDEYNKLIDKFGRYETEKKILSLNNYIMSKDKHYESHYHTILVWDEKNKKKDDDDHMPDLDELGKEKKYRDYFNMPDLDKLKKEGKI